MKKKPKVFHGEYRLCRDIRRRMSVFIPRYTTNNYRKIHGLPMRRKLERAVVYDTSEVVNEEDVFWE